MEKTPIPLLGDSQTVRKLQKLGSALMMATSEQNSPKRRIFVLLLIILSNIISVYCIYARCDVMIHNDLPEVLILMACVTAIPAWFLCVFCFCLNYSGSGNACSYYKLDAEIVATLQTLGFTGRASLKDFYLVIGCLTAFVLQQIGGAIYRYFKGRLYVYIVNSNPENVAMLILIYITFLIKTVAKCAVTRYRFLSNLPNLTVDRLKRAQKVARLLHQQCTCANHVFRIYVFMGVFLACFGCLSSICFLLTASHKVSYTSLVQIVISCGSRLVVLAVMTLALDGVTVAARNVSKMMVRAMAHTRNCTVMEELRFSAIYTQQLVPTFTAGCFTVDRYLLSSCLTAIASYLIVITQFSTLPAKYSNGNQTKH